jgi:hypothetical protein
MDAGKELPKRLRKLSSSTAMPAGRPASGGVSLSDTTQQPHARGKRPGGTHMRGGRHVFVLVSKDARPPQPGPRGPAQPAEQAGLAEIEGVREMHRGQNSRFRGQRAA